MRENSGARSVAHGAPLTITPDSPSDLFESSLVGYERKQLIDYRRIVHTTASQSVFSLAQNPVERCTASKGGVMQCVIAECHLYWHDGAKRWLSARELLTSIGFPCDTALHKIYLPALSSPDVAGLPVCSFNSNRKAIGFPSRKRGSCGNQAGNSMSVSSVGRS